MDDLENADDLAADLRAGLEGTGWSVKDDDPAAAATDSGAGEPVEEVDDLRADIAAELEAALGEQGAVQADEEADRAWNREVRRMADETFRRGGIDPADRHAQGLSRREVVRRLFNAEKSLRENPTSALAVLAQQYAGSMDDGGRLAAAQQFMAALGIQSSGALDQAAQTRLQHYEQQAAAVRTATEAAAKRAAERIEAFAKTAPHFATVRSVMGALMSAGEATTIESAYTMACRLRNLGPSPEDPQVVALKAAQARRDHAAKADKARTPKVASVSGDAPSDQSLAEDLRDTMRAMTGR
jgi:hypothetical protein